MSKLIAMLLNLWKEPTTKAGVGAALVALGSLVLHDGNWDAAIFPIPECPSAKQTLIGGVLAVVFRFRSVADLRDMLSTKTPKPGPILPTDPPK